MKYLLFLIFLACEISSKAQVSFTRPLEEDVVVNKIQAQFNHVFKSKEKLIKVETQVGQIKDMNENGFTYYMPYQVKSGKTWIYYTYQLNGQEAQDSLQLTFISASNYTCKVLNDHNAIPSEKDLMTGNYHFIIYKDNKEIDANVHCYDVVYMRKRGNIAAPKRCCSLNNEDALVLNKKCLRYYIIKKGDRLFFEDIRFNYLGNSLHIEKGVQLKY